MPDALPAPIQITTSASACGTAAIVDQAGNADDNVLTSRPGLDPHIVRGGKAYAFTANGGGSEVEVTTPSGMSCGRFSVQGSNVSIEADGTVIGVSDNGCTRSVYPGLLGAR